MRSYFKVYRRPPNISPAGVSQVIVAKPVDFDQDELIFIQQFHKDRAILAYNSLGFYALWHAFDENGSHVASFTGSQLANGLYITGEYSEHPKD